MSKYSRDKKPIKPDNKIRSDNHIVHDRAPSIILDNNNGSQNGVDLIYPKNTIVGNPFEHNAKESIPATIVKDHIKNDHYVTIVDTPNIQNTLAAQYIEQKSNDANNNNNDDKLIDEYKQNYLAQIYVGSLTVIGLFIFYRMVQKSR